MSSKLKKSNPKFLRRPDARPGQILDAAEKVFGKLGYEAATLDGIAKDAGITKGTIYLYFKNKKAVFLEMMKRRLSKLLDSIRQEALDHEIDSFEDYLGVVLPNLRNFITDPAYPNFFRLMMAESGRFPGIMKEFFRGTIYQVIEASKAVYGRDAGRKKVKDLDGAIVLRCLIGMHLAFVITQEIMGAKEYDPLEWDEIEKTIDIIFREGIRRDKKDA
jgi:AcrR family transcriptional regulator